MKLNKSKVCKIRERQDKKWICSEENYYNKIDDDICKEFNFIYNASIFAKSMNYWYHWANDVNDFIFEFMVFQKCMKEA